MSKSKNAIGGGKLEAKALAAAEAAYSRTCGGITEGRPMENAITAYCQTLAALPATGATEPMAERECSACGGVGYYLHGPAGDVECPRCKGTGKMSELPSGGEPEPVAWRWRYDDPVSPSVRLGWFFGPVEPPPDAIGRSWSGWECEPLFASPSKPSEAMAEAAAQRAMAAWASTFTKGGGWVPPTWGDDPATDEQWRTIARAALSGGAK